MKGRAGTGSSWAQLNNPALEPHTKVWVPHHTLTLQSGLGNILHSQDVAVDPGFGTMIHRGQISPIAFQCWVPVLEVSLL